MPMDIFKFTRDGQIMDVSNASRTSNSTGSSAVYIQIVLEGDKAMEDANLVVTSVGGALEEKLDPE